MRCAFAHNRSIDRQRCRAARAGAFALARDAVGAFGIDFFVAALVAAEVAAEGAGACAGLVREPAGSRYSLQSTLPPARASAPSPRPSTDIPTMITDSQRDRENMVDGTSTCRTSATIAQRSHKHRKSRR